MGGHVECSVFSIVKRGERGERMTEGEWRGQREEEQKRRRELWRRGRGEKKMKGEKEKTR